MSHDVCCTLEVLSPDEFIETLAVGSVEVTIMIFIILACLSLLLQLFALGSFAVLCIIVAYGLTCLFMCLWVVFPVLFAMFVLYHFKVSLWALVFQVSTCGLFSATFRGLCFTFVQKFKHRYEEGDLRQIVVGVPVAVAEVFLEPFMVRAYMIVSIYTLFLVMLTQRVLSAKIFRVIVFTMFVIGLGIWTNLYPLEAAMLHISTFIGRHTSDWVSTLWQRFNEATLVIWTDRKQVRLFHRDLVAVIMMSVMCVFYECGLIIHKNNPRATKRVKFAKVLRSSAMAFAKFVDGVRLPQIFRNANEAGMTEDERTKINDSIDEYISFWRDAGYPVDAQITTDDPVAGVAEGKFDPDWLIGGTNWRIHAPALKAFAQPEFRRFQHLVEEYRPSFSFQNVDNQLNSISRYFYNPENHFPEPDDVLDVVWPMVREIFANSKITPIWAIYKGWNKKFNVGTYATSSRRNRSGGFRKLPRREWIQKIGPRAVVNVFEQMAKYALLFDTHAQFFTKREWLKPSKWMNDVVRTPVAAMLPEYIVQMVFSAVPNKRFEYERTPIKLGMPMKHGTFEAMWARHARFNKHFAGDCTAFDSTIVGPVIRLIKVIRSKGFENHRDIGAISKVIDRTYDLIEHARLVSSTTGNVYYKGSGLMTGHAATSGDNSLAMVAYYLVAWKQITGRSAEEFKHYNELSVYGDDHVLSISDNAPQSWCWNNIVKTMATWGVTMREEVPSNGLGVPLNKVPFLKKFPRRPTTDDRALLLKIFGEGFTVPEFLTYHDPVSLVSKAVAAVLNEEPTYRVKRLISFLYLTAHNNAAYDTIHEGIEKIFRRYPNVREQQGRFVPSYTRVIESWFTAHTPFESQDNELDVITLPDSMVFYGEFSSYERIIGMFSDVPDLINPALRFIGPIEYMMRTYRRELSWPKQFITVANACVTKGHLESVLSNCSYDFLSKEIPNDVRETHTTLLVRHWLYMVLHNSKSYSFAFWVTGFFSKIISLNFIVNGHVAQTRPKFALSYYNLLLIYALNFVVLPEMPFTTWFIRTFKMPDLVGFVDDALLAVGNRIWQSVPVSFRDIDVFLLNPLQQKFVVKAPTGSGKSTDMIWSMHLTTNAKIIVIEPRVGLTTGLCSYMNSRFPGNFGYLNGEGQFDDDATVIYVTSRYFTLASARFMGQGNLFVVDEFHVFELDHLVAVKLLLSSDERVVFTSATPSPMGLPLLELPSSNVYSYERKDLNFEGQGPHSTNFARHIQIISRGHNPFMKHLIFVDSFAEMEALEHVLPGRVGTISSRGSNIPDGVTFILATSAADVGLTIPNVDIVITRDCQMGEGLRGIGRYRISESLIKQRCGRTGRTNNGWAYVLHVNEVFDEITDFKYNVAARALLEGGVGTLPSVGDVIWGPYMEGVVLVLRHFAISEPQSDLEGQISLMMMLVTAAYKTSILLGANRANQLAPSSLSRLQAHYVSFHGLCLNIVDYFRTGQEPAGMVSRAEVKGADIQQSRILMPVFRMNLNDVVGMFTVISWRNTVPGTQSNNGLQVFAGNLLKVRAARAGFTL